MGRCDEIFSEALSNSVSGAVEIHGVYYGLEMFGSRVWAMLNYKPHALCVAPPCKVFSEAATLQKDEEGTFLQHCVCLWAIEDKMKLQLLMDSLCCTKIFKGGITPLAIES